MTFFFFSIKAKMQNGKGGDVNEIEEGAWLICACRGDMRSLEMHRSFLYVPKTEGFRRYLLLQVFLFSLEIYLFETTLDASLFFSFLFAGGYQSLHDVLIWCLENYSVTLSSKCKRVTSLDFVSFALFLRFAFDGSRSF